MLGKLYRRAKLLLNPIKKGEILLGDCIDFGLHGELEQVRHRLRSLEGQLLFTFWLGDNTYRLKVRSAAMPYYILEAEVLTRSMDATGAFVWMPRTQERRIDKKKIHNMILEGTLKRSKI